jgi:flagellar hook-length control protein FliK
MSMPNAVTSGANAAPRNMAPASSNGAESGGLTLDFAALLMGLGAEEALDGQDAKALKSDDAATGATAWDAPAQGLTPAPTTPAPEAARANETLGAEGAVAAAVAGQAGTPTARAHAAGASEAAGEGVAAVGDGRPGGRKAAAQLPNLLKQAAYSQRMNGAQGGAQGLGSGGTVEAGNGASANAGGTNARAATLAATAAAAARGDDLAQRLNPRGSDALLSQQAPTPTLNLTTMTTTAAYTPDQKWEVQGPDRTSVASDAGLGGAAGVMGAASGAATAQSVLSAAPDAGLTTQMQVAEQVTYWVGQGVQNAEIEVRGIAESPIQISIDLQGVEAHVAFHAEQPETRMVLQEAVPQLRESLEREGLVLSGVSVGSSGGEDRSQRQAKGQDEGRRVGQVRAATTAAAATPAARPRMGGSSGRSVDLFV